MPKNSYLLTISDDRMHDIDATIEDLSNNLETVKDDDARTELESQILLAKLKREKLRALDAVAKTQALLADMEMLAIAKELKSELGVLQEKSRKHIGRRVSMSKPGSSRRKPEPTASPTSDKCKSLNKKSITITKSPKPRRPSTKSLSINNQEPAITSTPSTKRLFIDMARKDLQRANDVIKALERPRAQVKQVQNPLQASENLEKPKKTTDTSDITKIKKDQANKDIKRKNGVAKENLGKIDGDQTKSNNLGNKDTSRDPRMSKASNQLNLFTPDTTKTVQKKPTNVKSKRSKEKNPQQKSTSRNPDATSKVTDAAKTASIVTNHTSAKSKADASAKVGLTSTNKRVVELEKITEDGKESTRLTGSLCTNKAASEPISTTNIQSTNNTKTTATVANSAALKNMNTIKCRIEFIDNTDITEMNSTKRARVGVAHTDIMSPGMKPTNRAVFESTKNVIGHTMPADALDIINLKQQSSINCVYNEVMRAKRFKTESDTESLCSAKTALVCLKCGYVEEGHVCEYGSNDMEM